MSRRERVEDAGKIVRLDDLRSRAAEVGWIHAELVDVGVGTVALDHGQGTDEFETTETALEQAEVLRAIHHGEGKRLRVLVRLKWMQRPVVGDGLYRDTPPQETLLVCVKIEEAPSRLVALLRSVLRSP